MTKRTQHKGDMMVIPITDFDEYDIDVLLDMLLDEGDNLTTAQENLKLYAAYAGMERRYTVACNQAAAQVEALRNEIKRRCR